MSEVERSWREEDEGDDFLEDVEGKIRDGDARGRAFERAEGGEHGG